jgi:hypothetical protein
LAVSSSACFFANAAALSASALAKRSASALDLRSNSSYSLAAFFAPLRRFCKPAEKL